jgi:3-hydroxypropanoate dehydrogenase
MGAIMADEKTLDVILREARSHGDFHDRPVDPALLRKAHELMKWGPTTANSQPARIFYLLSKESREKLRPALSAVNVEKTMKAPLVAIVAYDTRFYEHLPRLYHNPDAINWYNKPAVAEPNAFRNSSLQGAYLIIALRAVGLDWLQQRHARRRLLPRRAPEVELPHQHRLRHGPGPAAAQSAPHFRGGLPDPLTGRAPRSSNS